MLQKDACLAYHTESIERTNMYSNQTLGTSIANRQASQVIMVWPCLPSRCAAKIILQGTVAGNRRRGKSHKSWRDNVKEWTGQSLSLLRIVDNRN